MQPFHLRAMPFGMSMACLALCASLRAAETQKVDSNCVIEIALTSQKIYDAPFSTVQFDVLVMEPDGRQLRVPGFWAGGRRWCFRFATDKPGRIAWRTEWSDASDTGLHGIEGEIEVTPYGGENPLYRHGPVRVSPDRRHFEHADGTPFFWLGDTWWKDLCKRLTWEGFQELTADRKAKGFSVVQIVCGVHLDEGVFEARWENGGGKPCLARDFSVVNPMYFEYADRRICHLFDAGIVLRFYDADKYVVGLHSPLLRTLFIHDRKDGQWGANLGEVPVPEIGPRIQIAAAVCGKYAACVLTDGKKTYWTPIVEVGNTTAGKAGLWLYQIGDRQEFDNFALSRARFAPVEREGASGAMVADTTLLYTDEYAAPSVPSPQDWVLVMERVKP